MQPDEEHGLTTFGAVLAIISTMIGGGIVGIPFAFLELGFWISITMMVFASLQTVNACYLYMKVKDLIPGKPESLYEIGYMLMGKSSIYIISTVISA